MAGPVCMLSFAYYAAQTWRFLVIQLLIAVASGAQWRLRMDLSMRTWTEGQVHPSRTVLDLSG